MVTSLNQSTPARESGYEGVQYICTRITPAGVTAQAYKIGTIPVGSLPIFISNRVVTALAGGTPLLTVGSNVGAVASSYNNLNATLAEAAASELLQPLATFPSPVAADTDIYVAISGGPITAGDVIVSIGFIKPLA